MIDLALAWRIDGDSLTLIAFKVLAAWNPGGPIRIFDKRANPRYWREDVRKSRSLIEATERVATLAHIMDLEYERIAECERRIRERAQRPPTHEERSAMERAEKYLERCEPSISGSGGAHTLMRVVGAVTRNFPELLPDDRLALLLMWDANNQPPWGQRELKRAIRSADRRERRRIA